MKASWAAEGLPGKPARIYLRITTGPVAGTYFPVGAAVARVVSQPSGSGACGPDASCGVAGVTAVASASEGSIANLRLVSSGFVETGIAQADLVYDAYHARGAFAGGPAMTNLRVIASLYPEAVQLIAAKKARIRRVQDLRGKRVAIGSPRSGTNAEARRLLKAFGLSPQTVSLKELGGDEATGLMASGSLDAMIYVGGWPVPIVTDLLATKKTALIPITGQPAERMVTRSNGLLIPLSIPSEAYATANPILTVGVQALWIVNAAINDDLVEGLCLALFHPGSRSTLAAAHPMGAMIEADHALDGVASPLHPGAKRCYETLGVDEQMEQVRPEAEPLPIPRKRPASVPSPATPR